MLMVDPFIFFTGFGGKQPKEFEDKKGQMLQTSCESLDSNIHSKYKNNIELLEELIGKFNYFQINIGDSHNGYAGKTPADQSAADSVANLFSENEIIPVETSGVLNCQLPNLCLGGPTSNARTRELLGYEGDSYSLVDKPGVGIRFRSVSNLEKLDDKRPLFRFENKNKVQTYPWIWRDREGKKHWSSVRDSENFQQNDYLKITKIRDHVIFDGLHGMGTRAVDLFFQDNRAIQDAIVDIRRQEDVKPRNQSYEVIFDVELHNDFNNSITEIKKITFEISQVFTPKI